MQEQRFKLMEEVETITFYNPITGLLVEIPVLPEGYTEEIPLPAPEYPSPVWGKQDIIGIIGALTALVIAVTGLYQLVKRRRNGQ